MKQRALLLMPLGALAVGVLIAGCGGSQPPISVPLATNERSDSLPYQKTFQYTGKEQSFVVPAEVTSITVVARGAAGRVYAVLPVSPGERLRIVVGGTGSITSRSQGGFNGGGNPGSCCNGLGGGGASDVRQGGNTLADRIFVAGGGGGEGGLETGGPGGAGGGTTGGAGSSGSRFGVSDGYGGSGGTQYTGGSGGKGGQGNGYDAGRGKHGKHGQLGRGAPGGSGGLGNSSDQYGGSGCGGGGGYYGGGGGGGRGGSSYVEPSATHAKMWQGWKNASGNGLIVLSWQ